MRVPKYRLHKPSKQAVVTVKLVDHYLGPYNSLKSKEAYRQIIAEYLASGNVARRTAGTPSISDLIASFLKEQKRYYGGEHLSRQELMGTEYGNVISAMRPLRHLCGSMQVTKFKPKQLKAVRDHLLTQHLTDKQKDGRPCRQLSRPTVNRRIKTIVRMFKWAASESLVSGELWHSLESVECFRVGHSDAPEPDPVLPVDQAIVDATIEVLPNVVADMIRFQLLVGCRPGEVCKITPAMVDRSNAGVWEIRLAKHKTAHKNKKRTIYVGPKAQEILNHYLDRSADKPCFSPREAMEQRLREKAANRMTPPNQGNKSNYSRQTRAAKADEKPHQKLARISDRYSTGTYGQAIAYACRLAFPPPAELTDDKKIAAWHSQHRWTPNQLRHATATRLRKSHGIDAASVILGHAELSVTQVYAEADREKAIEIMRTYG